MSQAVDDIEKGVRSILILAGGVLDITTLSQNCISLFDTLLEIRDALFGTV